MNIQRLVLAQKQLSETLTTKSNMYLLSDETSKYGKKIGGFHVSDDEGSVHSWASAVSNKIRTILCRLSKMLYLTLTKSV